MIGISLPVLALGLSTFIGLTMTNPSCDFIIFHWGPWGACDKPCGGGIRTRQCSYSTSSEKEQCNPICYNGGHFLAGHCHCVAGTTGSCCTDIPECASHPCRNGGTCNEMVNAINCTCPRRNTGTYCEKDLFSRHDRTCRPGSCYFVFRVKDTWEGAKKFCEARQGHLVVPDSMAEQLFLETYLDSMRVRYGDAFFWIGGKKSGTSPAHWITGPYATDSRWPLGVSDNVAGTQCLALDADYDFMWQAFPCDRTAYFICEETTPFSLGPAVG